MSRVLLIAALLLFAGPAAADETIPPPNELQFIDRHGASSECIGDPKTPLCAVETWLACDVRNDSDLCLHSGHEIDRAYHSFPGRGPVLYRVVDVLRPEGSTILSGILGPVHAEVRLIETNSYFVDGWYLDSEMVKRARDIKTRYSVELVGNRWRVTRRTECLYIDWGRCPSRR